MIEAFDHFWNLLHPWQWQRLSMAAWALVGLGSTALLLARRAGDRPAGRAIWVILAIAGPLLFLEMGWPTRYDGMQAVRSFVARTGGAEVVRDRRPWQALMIVVAIAAAILSLAWMAWSFRRWRAPARLAATGFGTSLTGFALEFISLHQVDAHYGVYWSFWFAGLGMMLAAIGLRALPGGPISPPAHDSGHRVYRVSRAEPVADPAEGPLPRAFRLACIAAALAIPEIVAWLSR